VDPKQFFPTYPRTLAHYPLRRPGIAAADPEETYEVSFAKERPIVVSFDKGHVKATLRGAGFK
jgi:hypothetical protein